MPIQWYNGGILWADGGIAFDPACCCGGGYEIGNDCEACPAGETPKYWDVWFDNIQQCAGWTPAWLPVGMSNYSGAVRLTQTAGDPCRWEGTVFDPALTGFHAWLWYDAAGDHLWHIDVGSIMGAGQPLIFKADGFTFNCTGENEITNDLTVDDCGTFNNAGYGGGSLWTPGAAA